MFAQFSDDAKTKIIAVFDSKQDDLIYENLGDIGMDDARYKLFYDELPDGIKTLLPTPQ